MEESDSELLSLIELSHFFGRQRKYVIAGGGNTSFKNKNKMWIKASGQTLAGMKINNLVCLSRALLDQMAEKEYHTEPRARESQVLKDLLNAVLYPKNQRPSVEALLHHFIEFSYVVHTHPTLMNGLLCSIDGEGILHRLFGDEVLFIPYTNPGYELSIKMKEALSGYKEKMGFRSNIILMQNHGVFVGANGPDAIRSFYSRMEELLEQTIDINLPDDAPHTLFSVKLDILKTFFENLGYHTAGYTNDLIRFYCYSKPDYQKISKPLTPDQIVYCGPAYLFIDRHADTGRMEQGLMEYRDLIGQYPKVILLEGEGVCIADEKAQRLTTILNVFMESLRIYYLAEGFGGPRYLPDEAIRFIYNWESEHYRRDVIRDED